MSFYPGNIIIKHFSSMYLKVKLQASKYEQMSCAF